MIYLHVIILLVTICVITGHGYYQPYQFSYGINDPKTGDLHQQHEKSDSHFVKGSYLLKETDGTTRLVKYEADPHSGFHADVEKFGIAHHPDHYRSFIRQINGYEKVSVGDNKKNAGNNTAIL